MSIAIIYPFQVQYFLVIGGFLVIYGLLDGGFTTILDKHKTKKKHQEEMEKIRQDKLEEEEWTRRFETNEESKNLVKKFAKKIKKEGIKNTTVKEDVIIFDKEKLKFKEIDKKDLSEIGCKAMAQQIKKELDSYEIETTVTRKTKMVGGYYVDRLTPMPRVQGDGGTSYIWGDGDPGKEVFDGYQISVKEEIKIELKEGSKDW